MNLRERRKYDRKFDIMHFSLICDKIKDSERCRTCNTHWVHERNLKREDLDVDSWIKLKKLWVKSVNLM
jgi:hypothetical protein